MFLGVRVHLHMGCVAARGSEKRCAVQLSPVQKNRVIVERRQNAQCAWSFWNQKKQLLPGYICCSVIAEFISFQNSPGNSVRLSPRIHFFSKRTGGRTLNQFTN